MKFTLALLLLASPVFAGDTTRFLTEWAIQQNCVNQTGHSCPEISVYPHSYYGRRSLRDQLDDIEDQQTQLQNDLDNLEAHRKLGW